MAEVFREIGADVPKKLQTVVLVGRPNVGKSTLFNRITGIRRAIVAPIAGTTRDVNSHKAEWGGVRFMLTDTGGMFGASEDPLHAMVSARGERALEEASVVVFVADAVSGALPADQTVAEALRATGKPVVLAVNKSDDRRAPAGTLEFHRLGFDPVIEISAEHGRGIGDLLEEVLRRLGSWPDASDVPAASEAGESGRRGRRRRACPGRAAGGNGGGDCRPAQRRQVVAREPDASRGARAREPHAGDHARCHRYGTAVAEAPVPHCRHRGHPPPGKRRAVGSGRARERDAGEARDRAGRGRGARARFGRGRHRPGRRDCRRGRQGGPRPHRRREQMGPPERGRAAGREVRSTTNSRGR